MVRIDFAIFRDDRRQEKKISIVCDDVSPWSQSFLSNFSITSFFGEPFDLVTHPKYIFRRNKCIWSEHVRSQWPSLPSSPSSPSSVGRSVMYQIHDEFDIILSLLVFVSSVKFLETVNRLEYGQNIL